MKLEDKLVFVNVNTEYIKALHEADSEVQYSKIGYDEKPFLGILVAQSETKYVIPLTSAKKKHLKWKDRYADGRFLITGRERRKTLPNNAIYKEIGEDEFVQRIYAATDVKKMIPVKEGLYEIVDLNYKENDNADVRNYKILQNKEYRACVKIMGHVARKASSIYEKQQRTGKPQKYACSFAKLEKAMVEWHNSESSISEALTVTNPL